MATAQTVVSRAGTPLTAHQAAPATRERAQLALAPGCAMTMPRSRSAYDRYIDVPPPIKIRHLDLPLQTWPRPMRRVRLSAFGNRGGEPVALTRRVGCLVQAYIGRKLVGYGFAYLVDDTSTFCIDEVAVDGDHQGEGVGTGLIGELLQDLEDRAADVYGLPTDPRMTKIFDRYNIPNSPFDEPPTPEPAYVMERGLPRPTTTKGVAIPYVSSGPAAMGNVNPGRQLEVVRDGLCQVCGDGLDEVALAVVTTGDRRPKLSADGSGGGVWSSEWPLDLGLIHERCITLAVQHCPMIGNPRDLRLLRLRVADYPINNNNRVEIPIDDQAGLEVSFDNYRPQR